MARADRFQPGFSGENAGRRAWITCPAPSPRRASGPPTPSPLLRPTLAHTCGLMEADKANSPLTSSSGDTPHPTPRGLQGPLFLEKPSQLPPTFLQGRQGESPSGEAQEPGAGLQSPSLGPQSPAWPRHDAEATQEPLRDSSGHLGSTASHDSSVLSSLLHSSLERCTDISRLSSGYAGDEENSEVSLPGSHQVVRLSRRLHTQAGGAQTRQVCAVYSPMQLKRRLARQANSTNQTGRE
ncbi:protein TNT [Muntiacus reevesi]|uniref:protein TNT n=1 Tax=Muntiacus reevesi TaxID=9886 RepID=UPI003306DC85